METSKMGKKFAFSVFLFFLAFNSNLSAATIIGGIPAGNEICVTSAPITLTANPNTNKSFTGGNAATIAAITNTLPGICTFDPTIAGVGTHTIIYLGEGDKYAEVIIDVINSTTTLDPFSDVCADAVPFALSGGAPAGGTYSGVGVDGSGNFDPSAAGLGNHVITYTESPGGCSASRNLNVRSIPVVSITPFDIACENDAAIALSGGSPGGGTYTGTGVTANSFDPVASGTGVFPITYTYSDGTCSNSDIENLTVESLPAVTILNLGNTYCQSDAADAISGTPEDANGTFTGPGITDFGNGTAVFQPAIAGAGEFTITYTYQNASGCVNSISQNVKVGTPLSLTGLESGYCEDEAPVTILGTPLGGVFTAMVGLTDNGDGSAEFDPSAAGDGTHTVEYTYIGALGCANIITAQVEVYPLPTPGFVGLETDYCTSDVIDNLTGNYAPSGSFSGNGVTDNGNGTAVFDPSALLIGGPYSVIYEYTNAFGCTASATRQTTIHPLPTATIFGDATICYGGSSQIEIALTGTPPFNFSYTDGAAVININGHGTNNYQTNVSPTTNSTYTLLSISDSYGCTGTFSGSATVAVNPLVTISTHPSDKTICAGTNTNFSAIANGVGITYQWQKDGVNIAGATSSVLTLNNVSGGDEADYRCVISSPCGGPLTSNTATLQLYEEVAISQHPTDDHLCTNEELNLQVIGSGSNITYQWKKDGSDIPGETISTYVKSGVTTADQGTYTCVISNSCGSMESNPAEILVDAPVIITSEPTDSRICEGENGSLSVTATGSSLSYQWQKNGGDIAGETSQSLIFNSVVQSDAGIYRCVITSPCGKTVNSSYASLTISIDPVITLHPVGGTLCEGDNTSFKVTATGSDLTYQWQKNNVDILNGGTISGANTNQLIISSLAPADAGNYKCIVSGFCSNVISNSVELVVDDNITINSQPSNKSVCIGNNTTLSVIASGSNLVYQWYKNGISIAGETDWILTLTSVDLTDAGSYYCEITNSCGRLLNSNIVTVTVNPLLNISVHPTDAVGCENGEASLMVTASGTNLTYQWYKDANPMADIGNAIGTHTNNLLLSNLQPADDGTYFCKVNSACGTANSEPAELIVDNQISIVTNPQDDTLCEWDNAKFSVSATGSNLSYQWQKDEIDIPGETGDELHLPGVTAADVAQYRCVITNSCGEFLNSQSAALSLYTETNISSQSAGVPVCEGTNIAYSVSASGSNLTYLWYKDGSLVSDFGNTTGTSTNTVSIAGATSGNAGTYTCRVSGSCGTAISEPIKLEIKKNTVILSDPQSKTVCAGNNTSFAVTAEGANLTWQWQDDEGIIGGKTQPSLMLENVAAADAGIYRCMVTGDCGTTFSAGASLTVNENIAITTQPSPPPDVCEGEQAVLSVQATGSGLSYIWKQNGSDLSDGAGISGSSTDNLIIDPATSSHSGIYECVINGSCGSLLSSAANLQINKNTVITTQPVNATACPGDNVLFNLEASGTNLGYQWMKNGVAIAGETGSGLLLANITAADAATYSCSVTGNCGTIVSQNVTLTVNSDISITTQPSDDSVCEGEGAVFSISATGTDLTYRWKQNGTVLINRVDITGATSNTLSLNTSTLASQGSYICEISGECGVLNSDPATLTVNRNTIITAHPANLTVCETGHAAFSVSAEGDDLTWQWQRNGTDIPGAESPDFIIASVDESDEGTYRCIVSGECDTAYSNGAILTVNQPADITGQPIATDEICENMNLNLSVSATGTGLAYQWKKGGTALSNGGKISGATSSNLFINGTTLSDQGAYTCEITSVCGSTVSSNISSITIKPATVITQQPVDYTVATGNNASFSVMTDGYDLTWKWQKDGVDLLDGGKISGAGTALLNLTGVDETDEGTYICIVTGSCNNINSSPANLIVNPTTNFITQPGSIIKCEGESASFSVSSSAATPLYQWKADGVDISDNGTITGATTANLSISAVSAADAGVYTCVVNGESSSPAMLTVHELITFNAHPLSKSVCEGNDISFAVDASGTIISYQWQLNGTDISDNADISGSQSSTLVLTNTSDADAGNYRCVITGNCGTVFSNPATLTVNTVTAITTQPSGNTICEGNAHSFIILAEGDNLTYSWKKGNTPLSDIDNISGTATASLTIDNSKAGDAGNYTCSVMGVCGTEESEFASLIVQKAPEITFQPADVSGCENDNVSFSLVAAGHGLTYQWQLDGADITDNGSVTGAETAHLEISGISEADAGDYRCEITATCNTIYSESASLTAYDHPEITVQPVGKTVCEESPVSFSVTATGTDLTYQWRKNGINITDAGGTSGSTTPVLYIAQTDLTYAGAYSCVVSGHCNSVISNSASLIIKSKIIITQEPLDFNGCEGTQLSLVVTASGSDLTYRWQKDGIDLTDGGMVSGSTSPNLRIAGVSLTDQGVYQCITGGYCGTTLSNESQVTVYKKSSITAQPSADEVCAGEMTSFSITAEGDNLTYTWKRDGKVLQDTGYYSGCDKEILNISATDKSYAGLYSCLVSGTCEDENSLSAPLAVNEATSIVTHPTGKTACEGEFVLFTVAASGENLSYQWQKDGVNLSDGGSVFGSQTNSLSITNLSISDNGAYRCVVTGDCEIVNSDEATLLVNELPGVAGTISGLDKVCQGTEGVLYEIPAIANAESYDWEVPAGVSIQSGSGTRAIIVDFAFNETGGNFVVRGVNGCGAGVSSAPLVVSAYEIPLVSAGSDQNICTNETILEGSAPGIANGTWTIVNGPAQLSDPSDNNSHVSNLRNGENTLVWSITKSGCSNSDTVKIFNNSVIANAGVDVTLCSSSAYLEGNTLSEGATGSWQVVSGTAGFDNSGDPETRATNFATGENLLKWSITKAGCTDSDTVIIDNQSPTKAYAGIDQRLCRDTTILQGNEPIVGTGEWSVITGSAQIIESGDYNTLIKNIQKGDNILRWTISNGICQSIDETTITNNRLTVNAGEDQVICDRSADLAATPPLNGRGTWSVLEGTAVFVNINQADTRVTYLSKGINTLQWIVENNGCLSADSVSIINDSPTTADAGEDQTVLTSSAILKANDPDVGTGQWYILSGAGEFEDAGLYNTTVSDLAVGDNTLRWLISYNSCTSSDEVVINYFVEREIDAGPDQVLCADNTQLEGNQALFGFGEWTVVKGSANFEDNSVHNTFVTGLSKGENILRWTIWENEYYSDDVKITNNTPTKAYAGPDRTVCVDSASLFANSPVIGTGKWSIVNGSATFSDSMAYNSIARELSQGSNTLKWTISNEGCESTDLVKVINDRPSNAFAGEDQSVCSDSTLLLPESPTIGSGEWRVISGSAIFRENSVYSLASGSNTLQWVVTNNKCTSSDDIIVINNMPTRARAGVDKVLCVDSITLYANKPVIGSGKWTTLNGSAIFEDETLNNTGITDITLGTNVFRWTIENNGCISQDEIELKYLYEAAVAGENQELCSNETFLNADRPSLSGGYWSVVGGSGTAIFENPEQPDTKVTGLDYGKNTLQWTVQNGGCKSVSEVVITNNMPYQASAGPDQSICGKTATLSALEAAIGTGVWSVLGGSGSFSESSDAFAQVDGLAIGSNTLRWTVEHKGCVSMDDVVIFNNSVTVSNAGDNQTLCIDSARLNANQPVYGTGEWRIVKGSAIFEDQQRYNSPITHLSQGENILQWYISNKQCHSESEVTITNNMPTTAIAGSDQDVCGSLTELNANTPEIGAGSWTLISGGGSVTEKSLPTTKVEDLNPGSTVFRWAIENLGCISFDEVTVNNNLPYNANAGTDITLCGPETRLYGNDAGEAVGTWSVVSGNAVFSDIHSHNPDIYELSFGKNTLQWTIDFEKCSSSDVVSIVNNKTTVNAGSDQVVNTSSTTLVASNPTSGTGTWSLTGGEGIFEKPEAMITKVNNIGSGINTYRWTVDVEGCLSIDEVLVTYEVPAEASFVADIFAGCPPLDVYFVNNSLSNLPFIWNFGDGTTSENVSVLHTFSESGNFKVSLTVYGDKGEVITKDTIIRVYQEPISSFAVTAEEIFIPEQEAVFINESEYSISCWWDFGDGSSSDENSPNHEYLEEGSYDVSLITWSEMGCSDTLIVAEAIIATNTGKIRFPNAFTPSLNGSNSGIYSAGDYNNDVFHPYGEGIDDYHLEIFNKWGILLFESFDINIGWDGYYKDNLVEEGAYVWKVSGRYNTGKSFVSKGTVMVLH